MLHGPTWLPPRGAEANAPPAPADLRARGPELEPDGLELLDDDVELDGLEASVALPEEDALQEVAEQTPYGEILLEDLIRRQLTLGMSVGAAFLVALFGLPLMNLCFPQLLAIRVFGLPMAWLALAVLIYPLLWVLGAYFVATSRKYEDEFTGLVK